MPNKKKITLTQAQINKLKKEITETAFKTSVQLFMLALHDEFGFGNERLTRLMVRVDRYSDTIEQRLVGMKEMGEIWEKNTGFRMGRWKAMSELKPCPFCGGEAELFSYEDEQVIYDSTTLGYVDTEYFTKYGCGCTLCGCIIAEMMSEERAVEAWNRRVEESNE